jgi:hypothetical protein
MSQLWEHTNRKETSHDLAVVSPGIRQRLDGVVRAVLPLDAKVQDEAKEIRLLKDAAFAEMNGEPGLAVLDFVHADDRWASVVAALPMPQGAAVDPQRLAVFLTPPYRTSAPLAAVWQTDYVKAMNLAAARNKMLFIFFYPDDGGATEKQFAETLNQPAIRQRLPRFVTLRLPAGATVKEDGREIALLRHEAFSEMLGLPGVAILDFDDDRPESFGCVVSVFPFLSNRLYTVEQIQVILDLPPGTLTQRTMIYAVRTHPDHPASTVGTLDPNLVREARSSAECQARIRLQGHHFWERRFYCINAQLPAGMLASEVCAESWPGQGLLAAAIECVRCWRLSSGHWRSVSAPQPCYGYDIQRGINGVWYATGIFGHR